MQVIFDPRANMSVQLTLGDWPGAKRLELEIDSAQEVGDVAQLTSSLKRAHCCGIRGKNCGPMGFCNIDLNVSATIRLSQPTSIKYSTWNQRSGHRVRGWQHSVREELSIAAHV